MRHPVGGHVWHHLQYLVGLKRLGHEVTYFEHYGSPASCYDSGRDAWTSDPSYGIAYLLDLLRPHGLDASWCFIAEDGACRGLQRVELERACRDCDLFLNLSNINWIPELELCRRRALVDTDPVFTQIGAHGVSASFSDYHALFTYGENVHKAGCEMPTAGYAWLPTRQPVVLDLWRPAVDPPSRGYTSIMNSSAFGETVHEGRVYGQKDRQFEPFFALPRESGETMQLAVSVPEDRQTRLEAGGWQILDPLEVALTPGAYQAFLRSSKAEFSTAKHAYVSTQCGWFSDRSAGYLASGRPVVIEDAGFSQWLETGRGVMAFRSHDEALAAITAVNSRYEWHCRAAREVAHAYFDAGAVLTSLVERAMNTTTPEPRVQTA